VGTLVGMKYFIKFLKSSDLLKRKDTVDGIKKDCIKELHKSKINTLTMGGVVMNVVLFIMTIAYYLIKKEFLWINIFIIAFGVMGFIDDYIKIKKGKDGVTPKEKLIGLTIISIVVVVFFMVMHQTNTQIIIPFINTSIQLNGVVYAVLMMLLVVATTNSVNITDGLDGLVLGISVIVLSFLGLVAWRLGNNEVLFSVLVVMATCIGALFYNWHPAKIFIGDTGSLFLGGAIALFAIRLNIPMWLIIILIVCLWETISVILQLTSLKFTGKRIFKIAPYHHHLEKSGWIETKIVYLFWAITGVFCIIGYFAMGGILP
jgi:phospho-N-acetylmuramoyl-pentapeptide-transferase